MARVKKQIQHQVPPKPKVEGQKKVSTNPKCKWYRKVMIILLYNDQGTKLSRTALMNFVFFSMSIILFGVGLAFAFYGKTIPNELYLYCSGLTGGSFLQYTYGKKLAINGQNGQKVHE